MDFLSLAFKTLMIECWLGIAFMVSVLLGTPEFVSRDLLYLTIVVLLVNFSLISLEVLVN